MGLFSFLSVIITRTLFILVSLIGVWRVAYVKESHYYWFLTFLFLPLVVEMIITLRNQEGKDYKWFSPTILLFLISIVPSIWILELHHQQNKAADNKCNYTDGVENLSRILKTNATSENFTLPSLLKNVNEALCPNNWILALHQILLILLILGKWLLPLGDGVTKDQLSQLLLIFVGTAADILEFTSETLNDITDTSPELVYIILAVWSWSMLQFPCHLSVVKSMGQGGDNDAVQGDSLWSKYSTDLWSIVETLFIQDGPFLVVRLTVLTHYRIIHQMLIFFTVKNFLVVILNLYRLFVICQDFRFSQSGP
ncbi:transmembrane protein 26 [Austrofundulus limnaeus]|uniref:Transmembrane protein 26 n=1 Tax=Austrofundulus limnaeus TaxID=52670 RepID=A0A2I4D4N2_AUSLI|nr:PREDICTED: transmembrane protein 26 [Austrofundulus limnaeus]